MGGFLINEHILPGTFTISSLSLLRVFKSVSLSKRGVSWDCNVEYPASFVHVGTKTKDDEICLSSNARSPKGDTLVKRLSCLLLFRFTSCIIPTA